MKTLAFVVFALAGLCLLAARCIGCSAPQAAALTVDGRNEIYLFEMDHAVMSARTCPEAAANVADVRARWLPYWPAAPLPAVHCPNDGGAPNDAH